MLAQLPHTEELCRLYSASLTCSGICHRYSTDISHTADLPVACDPSAVNALVRGRTLLKKIVFFKHNEIIEDNTVNRGENV